jgi:HTH-type transcriptional regulator/antitoxin HipB
MFFRYGASELEQLARNASQIGNALRRRRRLLKLTQNQLAERTGLRQATISLLEAGGSDARLSTLTSMLAGLNLELIVRDRTKAPKIEDIF